MVKEPFELRSLSLKTELYFQRNNRVEKGFQEEERAKAKEEREESLASCVWGVSRNEAHCK